MIKPLPIAVARLRRAWASSLRGWPWARRGALVCGGLLAVGMLLGAETVPSYDDEEEESAEAAKMPPGEKAARRACTICHAFPTPDLLDKEGWRVQILPRMKVQLGIAKPDYSSSPEGELIRARGLYPETLLVPAELWPLIQEYYLTNAPDKPLPQAPRAPITIDLKQFKGGARFRAPIPTTTLVKISTNTHRIYVGDDNTKSLFILDSEGRMLRQVPLDNVPADVVESDQGLYVTCVGSYIPSEIYRAALVFLEKKGDDFGEPKVILKELPRSVQAEFGDFNEDGRMDFALCMFGNLTGRFSWYENLGQGEYREHVLSDKTGAIRCVAYDFNRDGHLDLALLMAQHFEMLILLYNDGRGNFTGNMVLQRPPPWGHNYFELADFNQDGRMDLLVVNGDNGEYQSPLKRYHGVRIYLNQGDDQFEEAYFYPINGAYKAIARDYDQDGDLDIAVISYFPDYRPIGGSPRESFVYLENQGGLKFTAHTYRECIAGRWMVMDAADLDGDGDLDLVLGSYILGPSPLPIPEPLMETWRRVGPSVQILRNTLK